jgi:Uma2 family endonuclease
MSAAIYHTELIDNQEIQKPVPKTLHAIVQGRLIFFLMQWASNMPALVLPEQNVLCGEDRLVPDITLIAMDGPFYDGDLRAADITLAIEIASPGQKYSQLIAKCERLHESGARMCWVILPSERKAVMHRRSELPEQVSVLRIFADGRPEDCAIETAQLFASLEMYEAQGAL